MFRHRHRPNPGSADADLGRDFDALTLSPLAAGYRERFFSVLLARRRRMAVFGTLDVVLWLVVGLCGVIGLGAVVMDAASGKTAAPRWLALGFLLAAVLALLVRRAVQPRDGRRFHRDVAGKLASAGRCYVDLTDTYAGSTHEDACTVFAEQVEEIVSSQRGDWIPDEGTPESVGRLRFQLRHDVPQLPARLYFYVKALVYAVAGSDNEETRKQPIFSLDHSSAVDRINARAREIADERAGLRLWRTFILVSSLAIPLISLWIVPIRDHGDIVDAHLSLGIGMAFAEAFCLIILLFVRRRVALLGAQLQLLEYDVVIASLVEEHEKTAANLFFKHQAELKQYYDQTLRQNRQAFVLGVFCVLLGLGSIVGVVAILMADSDTPTAAKITAGALGGVAALLTGFVARVYLRVYEGSALALGDFHRRLVSTNHFHFANLLVSSVKPDDKRTTSLAELAAAIATNAASKNAEED